MIVLTLKNWHRITRVLSETVIRSNVDLHGVVNHNMGTTKGLSGLEIANKSVQLVNILNQEGMWDYSLQKWNPDFNKGWADYPVSTYSAAIGMTFEKSEQFLQWQSLINGYKHN